MKISKLGLGWLMVLAMSSFAEAATEREVPHYVNFQSVLRDDSGNLIEESFIDLQVKILRQDGNPVYEETQPGVQVVRGAINIMVGEGVKPDSSVPTGGIPAEALDPKNGDHFLQVQFGSNEPSGPMEIGMVPYAMYAEQALSISPNIIDTDIPEIFVTEAELEERLTTYSSNIVTTINNSSSSTTINESHIDQTIMRDTEADALFVNVAGDTMTGNLNMGNQSITNVNQVDGVDLSTLSSTVSNHTTQIGSLNATVSGHTTQIGTLNTTAADHENRIATLEAKPEIRAWAYVEDGDGSLGAKTFTGYNVASVVRENHATYGEVYRIIFSNLIGGNYAANATANRDIDGADRLFANVPSKTSSVARVRIKEESSGQDYGNFSFTVIK